mgnify:CR=1 FL=1
MVRRAGSAHSASVCEQGGTQNTITLRPTRLNTALQNFSEAAMQSADQ